MPVHALLGFNRGIVSPKVLARIDVKRMNLSAETQTNFMPRTLGPMSLRPGLGYITSTRSDAAAKYIEFVYSGSDMALIELTDSAMRVIIDDVVISRPAVTSKFDRWNGAAWVSSSDTSSGFGDATDVGYWKDNDESGGTSALHSTAGYLSLLGNGTASAIRDRRIAVVETNVEHSLEITVTRGKVMLTVGTSEGGSELLTERTLRAGYHSISVTPTTSTMFVRLSNADDVVALVDIVTLGQAAADMVLTTPWTASDLSNVRWSRINDVTFVACYGIQQKRIERQGADSPRSWSVVEYAPEDGPFREINTGPVRLKGSALTGDITLTAERSFFRTTHVGGLFSLTSAGQEVTQTAAAENTFTSYIRVTGTGTSRSFTITLAGTLAASTVTLQRSVSDPGDWQDVTTYIATTTTTYTDGLDNQIIYYRIGIKTGGYGGADSVAMTLTYSAGSITGIVRVTGYTSATSASAQVLTALGKANQYTQDWREGDWSPKNGYPSAVADSDGRLFWAGKGYAWGSVSDALDSFDDTIEGDSGPIRRTLGEGAVDRVNWLQPATNLLCGFEGTISAARSSSLDEPLTPTKFNVKPIGDVGTAAVPAIRIDTSTVYVGANESRVYESSMDAGGYNYTSPGDLTALCPEIGEDRFLRRAFQRFPDRRLHLVRGDGKAAVMIFDKLENVTCWIEVETDGTIEDVVVIPGPSGTKIEDRVYYVVARTINGTTKRFLEKWARESQCIGAADNRLADCHVTGTLSASTTVPVAHLEGETVCLWGNSKDLGTYTVSGGAITASEAITGSYCVGLVYTGQYKSGKRALAEWRQMMLTQHKTINSIGLVLADTHHQGLQYGPDFTTMDDLPQVVDGVTVTSGTIHSAIEFDPTGFPNEWDTDPRLCLEATAPRPCTVMAVALVESGG